MVPSNRTRTRHLVQPTCDHIGQVACSSAAVDPIIFIRHFFSHPFSSHLSHRNMSHALPDYRESCEARNRGCTLCFWYRSAPASIPREVDVKHSTVYRYPLLTPLSSKKQRGVSVYFSCIVFPSSLASFAVPPPPPPKYENIFQLHRISFFFDLIRSTPPPPSPPPLNAYAVLILLLSTVPQYSSTL